MSESNAAFEDMQIEEYQRLGQPEIRQVSQTESEQTTESKKTTPEQILQSLPEFCDADNVAEVLEKFMNAVNEYLAHSFDPSIGYFTVQPIIDRLKKEKPVSNSDLQDKTQYRTIQFEQEGQTATKVEQKTKGYTYEINFRQLIKNLDKVNRILSEAYDKFGEHFDIESGRSKYSSAFDSSHITLNYQGMNVSPAIRFQNSENSITDDIFQLIAEACREGRKIVEARESNTPDGLLSI